MVNNCATCQLQIKRGAPGLLCAGDCGKFFHDTCVNLTKNIIDTYIIYHHKIWIGFDLYVSHQK